MLLTRLAHVSQEVAATSARSRKIALLAELFREADADDVPIVIPYLAGRLPQGRLGIGWKVLDQQIPGAVDPSLTVRDVDARLSAIGAVTGAGSQAERRRLVGELLAAATTDEQRFLFALITGEVRQGALDAVAVEGLATATGAPPADVRRAVMLAGAIQPVAQALLADGPAALARFRLTVGRPVLPMLAHSASSVAEAVEKLGACAVEEKLDGIRVQVHRDGDDVRIYTRTLDDITDRLPELTTAARALRGDRFILDGEVIAFDTAGRPRSFQDTAGRVGSRVDVETAARETPVSPSSSTRCRSTATTSSTSPSPSGTPSWPAWSPNRCGYDVCWSAAPPTSRRRRGSCPTRSRAATRASWSRLSTPPTARAGAGRPG